VWTAAFEAEGVDPRTYLGTIPVTARLPWDHVSVGLEEGFLAREYRKALASRLSPPCGKAAGMFVQHTNLADLEADQRKLVCYDCGVACDLSAMRGERRDYLVKLDAKTRRPTPVSPLEAPVPLAEDRVDPRRAVVGFTQGAPRRYRFGFTKLGPSAYLSHLDLLRALPRSFRRVGLPLFYSTGFHPKPDFVFAPALSLGVASTCEVIDVKLTSDIVPEQLLEQLTHASPEGMSFFAGVSLGPTDRSVSRLIDAARYAIAIPASVLDPLGGEAWLRGRAAEVLAASSVPVKRMIEGIGKWIDVREYLRGLVVEDPSGRAAIDAAGIVGRLVTVTFDVEIRGSGAVKTGEVVQAIAGEIPHRAVRVALGRWESGAIVSPFTLERRVERPVELAV
jgi:radical SAM-linked protein